jgi:hypothetical protein
MTRRLVILVKAATQALVIPAKAGIQTPSLVFVRGWTPAFAGVTGTDA